MTQLASADQSTAAPSDLPPPYENATSSNSEQTPFVSYSDEKTHPSDTAQDAITNRIPTDSPKIQGGGPSQPLQPSQPSHTPKHAGKKWSSTPKRVSCIAPSIAPGHAILRTRCFHSKSQHLRLALATSTTVQVYDAMRDSLLWELHSNSSQLVQGNEEPLTFGEGFRPSPDGSLLCVIASGRDQRRLLIVDSETGWVKLECALSATDGNKPHISPDNTTAVLCHSGSATDSTGHFKIFSLIEEQANVRRLRFDKPASWQGMSIRFAPDSKHVIACAGPIRKVKHAAAPSVSVCVYDIGESGKMVRSTSLACSPKFNNTSQNVKFAADFHFPSLDEWLVSFPDYSSPGKTCIVNARLGQTVAVFSSELTLSQKWQVGVQSPGKAQVAHDAESGIFTRMELSNTIFPRGQTVTITKFALSANGGREKSVVRKPFQIRAVVLSCKHADVCGLSPDGSHMFVQQGAAGKVDVLSLTM
ncbi:hypothetical protein C2857_005244 [Epichloe festucae Fl1]|uniref:Uncharacterized protein n=1 Tax=Epichloe festucae (strain Fl1) TaxID=877507 RepID=A0A7S9KPE4_EPIFF|nr:hypothetical protein C2857_005244 [Epichloe festucae Fl1]